MDVVVFKHTGADSGFFLGGGVLLRNGIADWYDINKFKKENNTKLQVGLGRAAHPHTLTPSP